MTRIKLCGLSRPEDIETANALQPDMIGFVFVEKSRRYVSPETAVNLRGRLSPGIRAVGVFVRESPESVAKLLNDRIIDLAQLHGGEGAEYISRLRELTGGPLIQAFRIDSAKDLEAAEKSPADLVLLDNGAGGTGSSFDWSLLRGFSRPYLLAGGLSPDNVGQAVETLNPWGVDVSSGIETDGVKDPEKMRLFVEVVRARSGTDSPLMPQS